MGPGEDARLGVSHLAFRRAILLNRAELLTRSNGWTLSYRSMLDV